MAIVQYYIGSHGPYFVDDTSDQFISMGQVIRREEFLEGESTLENKTLISPAVDEIKFDPTLTPVTLTEGSVHWNWQARCPEYITGLGNTVQIGQETWGIGRNMSGVTVSDGTVVYMLPSTTGPQAEYALADASDGAKCGHIGVVTYPTANLNFGPVTVFGLVHNINTSAWAEGTRLYLSSSSPGSLTSTPPAAPNYRIAVAQVIYQHSVNGKIFVNPHIDYNNGITFKSLDVINNLTAGSATIAGSLSIGSLDVPSLSTGAITGTSLQINGAATITSSISAYSISATSSISGSTVSASSTITGGQFRVSSLNTAPATATSTGTTGEIRFTADHIYVCTATNTWKRAALATW